MRKLDFFRFIKKVNNLSFLPAFWWLLVVLLLGSQLVRLLLSIILNFFCTSTFTYRRPWYPYHSRTTTKNWLSSKTTVSTKKIFVCVKNDFFATIFSWEEAKAKRASVFTFIFVFLYPSSRVSTSLESLSLSDTLITPSYQPFWFFCYFSSYSTHLFLYFTTWGSSSTLFYSAKQTII